MYIQYYSYSNVILILTVHGINCKDEREHGKAVIMNLFKFSSAVTNIIAKMYSQPLKYVINLKLPFQMIHAVVVVQCLYPSLFLYRAKAFYTFFVFSA